MNPSITIAELSYEGFATAVATLRTALWAGQRDSVDEYFDCFTPEIKEQFQNACAKEAERATSSTRSPRGSCGSPSEQLKGARVYGQYAVSDKEVELDYELYRPAAPAIDAGSRSEGLVRLGRSAARP